MELGFHRYVTSSEGEKVVFRLIIHYYLFVLEMVFLVIDRHLCTGMQLYNSTKL